MEKAVKVLEKVEPNVIARSFVTTSVSLLISRPLPFRISSSNFHRGIYLIFPIFFLEMVANLGYRGNHETRDSSSRPSRRSQTNLWSHLRRSTLLHKICELTSRHAVFSKFSLKVLFVMLSLTLNMPRERRLRLLMLSML